MGHKRHPADESSEDRVAATQEEVQWSAYTHLYRATSQGKLLFPARHLRGWRRVTMYAMAVLILLPFALYVVAGLVVLFRGGGGIP